MFPHRSDQMSQRPKFSKIALWDDIKGLYLKSRSDDKLARQDDKMADFQLVDSNPSLEGFE